VTEQALSGGAEIVAYGLRFPEGPVYCSDGSVIVVEVARGTVSRVGADGRVGRVATVGGGPNGAAVGPDSALYVCNNGGLEFTHVASRGWLLPGHQPDDYVSGSLQRIDLTTGETTVVYDRCGDVSLRGPNDLVFDRSGGLWFTDHGKTRARDRDLGGIYWARADGSEIREVVHPLETPNGIGLSPSGDRLYVAETVTQTVWWWEVTGSGELALVPNRPRMGGTPLASFGGSTPIDSLAIDADGNVCVGTLGAAPAINVIAPDGCIVDAVPMPDPLPTNVCFGGPDGDLAYVTLSASGQIARVRWPRPGAPLAFTT
jgi:gluconolactonase